MAGKFTPLRQEKYLAHIRENGLVNKAAASVGVCPETVRAYRKRNPEFKALEQDARDDYTERLIAEANRRAVEGVPNDVFYQGEKVGEVQKYSDRLLELLLKRNDPTFREKNVEINQTGGVMVVNQTGGDPNEWAEKHNAAKSD